MKALVVDGDERDRRRLIEAFAEPDFQIVEAGDLPAARRLLECCPEVALVVCGASLSNELARAAPQALVILTAWPDELLAAIAGLGERAFDALQKPLDPEACSRAFARAHGWLSALEEVRQGERALAEERARIDEEIVALEREADELPRLERLRAGLAREVASELQGCLSRVPARLDDAAALVEDTGARAAIVDGAGAARQALRMVTDLLDVARAEHGPLPHSTRRVSLAPFLAEVLGGVERVASDYDTGIDLAIGGGFSECETDPDLLRRALQNLLETALRRSRRGRVRFEVNWEGDRLRFSIADRGGVVPERLLAGLFGRLSRLEPGTIERGAGLGFCRAAVEALGGTLEAAREGEVGLRLSLALPGAAA